VPALRSMDSVAWRVEQVGGVALLVLDPPVVPPVERVQAVRGDVGVVIDGAAHEAAKLIEPAVHGVKHLVVLQVPRADEGSSVSVLAEQGGEREFLRGDPPRPALLRVVPPLLPVRRREIRIVDPRAPLP